MAEVGDPRSGSGNTIVVLGHDGGDRRPWMW